MPPQEQNERITAVVSSYNNNHHHHFNDNNINNNEIMSEPMNNHIVTQNDNNFENPTTAGRQRQQQSCSSESNCTRPSNEYVLNVAFISFVGFVIFQAIFAIIANSQSMLADSEAMSVDALTYLFNLVAERMKNRPLSEQELQIPTELCHYNRQLRRLYLELIPPLLSVVTLLCVTVMTLKDAITTLHHIEKHDGDSNDADDDVSVTIMLIFSSANLVLDFVNVTCFARSNSLFGLDMITKENFSITHNLHVIPYFTNNSSPVQGCGEETSGLLEKTTTGSTNDDVENSPTSNRMDYSSTTTDETSEQCCNECDEYACSMDDNGHRPTILSNLNMCSAWTHICADTLRSLAVIIAAAIAVFVPSVNGAIADAVAAIVVSVIIFGSLLPLFQGLVVTALEIVVLQKNPPCPF